MPRKKPSKIDIVVPTRKISLARVETLDASEDECLAKCKTLVELVQEHAHAELVAYAVLVATYKDPRISSRGAKAVVAQMIAHCGANALDYWMEKGGVPFDALWATLRGLVVREEMGQPIRLYDGGNIAHFLCSVHRLGMLRFIMQQKGDGYYLPSWSSEKRKDGKTPLHVAWDIAVNNYSTPDELWEASALLLDRGCDPLIKDNKGQQVADLIEQARTCKPVIFEWHDAYRERVLGLVDAAAQGEALGRDTPKVSARARGRI